MKAHPAAVTVVAAAFLFAGCTTQSVVSAPPSASKISPNPKGPLPVLKIGMSAEQVRSVVGTPTSIAPLESAAGNGETWNYRRVVDEKVESEAVSTSRVSSFNGVARDMGSEIQMQYRMKRTVTYQETALLMFDGKLVSSKQWISKDVSYDG